MSSHEINCPRCGPVHEIEVWAYETTDRLFDVTMLVHGSTPAGCGTEWERDSGKETD